MDDGYGRRWRRQGGLRVPTLLARYIGAGWAGSRSGAPRSFGVTVVAGGKAETNQAPGFPDRNDTPREHARVTSPAGEDRDNGVEAGSAKPQRYCAGFGERGPPQGSGTPEEVPTRRSARVLGSTLEQGQSDGIGVMTWSDRGSREGVDDGRVSRDRQAIGCQAPRSALASASRWARLAPARHVLRHGRVIAVRQSRHGLSRVL